MSNIVKMLILLIIVILILILSTLYFNYLTKQTTGENEMTAEIIKLYTEEMPSTRFIGKKYNIEDQHEGSFSNIWDSWFTNGWFEQIENQSKHSLSEWFQEGDAYIGLERMKDNEPFEYYIGIFMPSDTIVPEGFISIDFQSSLLGIAWIQGTMENIFIWEEVRTRLINEGYVPKEDKEGVLWSFERYVCPRFTTPDSEGKIILDYGYFINYY